MSKYHWTKCSRCHRVLTLSNGYDDKIHFVIGYRFSEIEGMEVNHSNSNIGYKDHMNLCAVKYGDAYKFDRIPIKCK